MEHPRFFREEEEEDDNDEEELEGGQGWRSREKKNKKKTDGGETDTGRISRINGPRWSTMEIRCRAIATGSIRKPSLISIPRGPVEL